MKKGFKLSASLVFLALFAITYIAFTGDNTRSKTNGKQDYALADDKKKDDNKAVKGAEASKVYFIESVSKPEAGKAVDFKFKDGSKTRSFRDLTKGKVVFLNFWGTWCPPCRREIPDIIQLSKELKAKDFVVIGIAMEGPNVDKETAHTKVSDFSSTNGMPYVNFVVDPEHQDIKEAYGGIPAVPTTFIIDKNGNIVEKLVGMRDKAAFMASINKVLK